MSKPKLVVLSGAGISAESGIATFRDSDGLWENHKVEDVASPEGWKKNPELVQNFYNQRRKRALEVVPNPAHHIIKELEDKFEVLIITQNVDNLHERAGSSNVMHLHGELFLVRSEKYPELIYPISKINSNGWELKMGDLCEKGFQLRPHIVWFGEEVPMIKKASQEVLMADVLVVVGTSLQVYPAAGLIGYTDRNCKKFIVDPKIPNFSEKNWIKIEEKASTGMKKVQEQL
ncbi:MAG: NAD-dependent deacylase [Bacteroidetes bacterium]|nr:MAG: NAD-dependent deacylase [Bacteroidota bacterium]